MIKVIIEKDKTNYKEISILGHAMYAPLGKDIVCSAVSSIVTTTINGLLSLDKECLVYEVNEDGMKITILKTDNTTQILLDNMVNLLRELEKNYKKNIKVM